MNTKAAAAEADCAAASGPFGAAAGEARDDLARNGTRMAAR